MLRKICIGSFVLLTLFLSSCVASKKDSMDTKEGLASLEKFDPTQSVLLIEKITKGNYRNLYNKRRMGDCKQFYKGKVEAAILKEVEDDDPYYQDRKIYRYMLVETSVSTDFNYSNSNGTTKTNTHRVTNYSLLDRLTGKQFDLNVAGANPDRVFKKAVQKLNAYMKTK